MPGNELRKSTSRGNLLAGDMKLLEKSAHAVRLPDIVLSWKCMILREGLCTVLEQPSFFRLEHVSNRNW